MNRRNVIFDQSMRDKNFKPSTGKEIFKKTPLKLHIASRRLSFQQSIQKLRDLQQDFLQMCLPMNETAYNSRETTTSLK